MCVCILSYPALNARAPHRYLFGLSGCTRRVWKVKIHHV